MVRIVSTYPYYLDSSMRKILLFNILLSIGLAQFNPYDLNNYTVQRDSVSIPLPAKAMFKSLLIPGWGQFHNKDNWWKAIIFAGVETLGIISAVNFENKAERIRRDFEAFGDKHWALERWYKNTQKIFPDSWYNTIIGTHKLSLKINGNYYFSDKLTDLIKSYTWTEITVIRDRNFYENIGKYDQFVGGWDDVYDDPFDSEGSWYTIKKGNVESIILTEQKNHYRSLRHDSNILKHYSKYSVSAVMFNHLASALEAAYTANKKDKNLPKFGLNYDPLNKWGVGGVQITYAW